MFEKLTVMSMAQAMANRAGQRLELIARNIANADTPGYKALDVSNFASSYQEASMPMRATRAGHLTSADEGFDTMPRPVATGQSTAPNGNSVSIEQEMVKAASVKQDHEMALAIYRNSTDIIRAALGRSR